MEIKELLEIILLLLAIIIFTLLMGGKVEKDRCYNLPVNDFFQDKKCEKHWRNR